MRKGGRYALPSGACPAMGVPNAARKLAFQDDGSSPDRCLSIFSSTLAGAPMAQPTTPVQLGLHKTKPYESDGGFSAAGLFVTTGAGVAVALVAGVVAAFVGQYFYAVLIYPALIGCAVGGTQAFAIRHTKIRTPLACGAAGLIAGVVA